MFRQNSLLQAIDLLTGVRTKAKVIRETNEDFVEVTWSGFSKQYNYTLKKSFTMEDVEERPLPRMKRKDFAFLLKEDIIDDMRGKRSRVMVNDPFKGEVTIILIFLQAFL